jgi:glycosidase
MASGTRVARAFRWDDEFQPGQSLPQNNQIVIYEMPVKWMSSDPSENPLVELGTFDKALFEHLDDLVNLGVNCIELLPVEDTTQTLNWGYGTRFFFAPDIDIGTPVDAKFFIKSCHQRGVRVLLDVVMSFFAPQCPLAALAPEWFYEPSVPGGRNGWGQDLFHFNTPSYGNYFAAREFLCEMAEFWVTEYHVDGFRIDDFVDIANWDFVQAFRDRATSASQTAFPGKPFVVVAEDTNREFVTTGSDPTNPNGRKVVDAIWNFGYQSELRLLATDAISTAFGQPSRSARVQHAISKDGPWNAWGPGGFDPGYADMVCAVDYVTSHDVANAPRMMNVVLGPLLQAAGLGDGSLPNVRAAVDTAWSDAVRQTVAVALHRIFGVFAIVLTSVGMPMFLAGEEFGDVHDTDYTDVNVKQEDPVQWGRAQLPAHSEPDRTFRSSSHCGRRTGLYNVTKWNSSTFIRSLTTTIAAACSRTAAREVHPWVTPGRRSSSRTWDRNPFPRTTSPDGPGTAPRWQKSDMRIRPPRTTP